MNTELPGNVHILTLEPWKDHSILLRLEHFLTKTDDPNDLSKQAVVNLRILFSGIKIISYRETSLTANQWIEDFQRLDWQTTDKMVENFNDIYDGSYQAVNGSTTGDRDFPDKDKFSFFNSLSDSARNKLQDYLNLNFPDSSSNHVKSTVKRNVGDNDFLVYLQPMEIKTLIIKAEFSD